MTCPQLLHALDAFRNGLLLYTCIYARTVQITNCVTRARTCVVWVEPVLSLALPTRNCCRRLCHEHGTLGAERVSSWCLKRFLPPKKKGNESLPRLQLWNHHTQLPSLSVGDSDCTPTVDSIYYTTPITLTLP